MVDLWQEADEGKFAELLLYVAGRLLDDPSGGSTKINKVLYFSELAHIRAYGVPITGVRYQKLKHGPAPRRLVPVREKLIATGSAEMQVDGLLQRLVPLRAADMTRVSEEELGIINEVIDSLGAITSKESSELSHEDIGWQMVESGADIPLCLAYAPERQIVSEKARAYGRQLAETLGLITT